jgi:hypothetical protein
LTHKKIESENNNNNNSNNNNNKGILGGWNVEHPRVEVNGIQIFEQNISKEINKPHVRPRFRWEWEILLKLTLQNRM